MARKTVISKVLDVDARDGIIEFPQNRTLYADQFTDGGPASDEYREGFKAKNMKDVFEHYQPCKKGIVLETEEGATVYEDFYFNSIETFEDNQLIEQSSLLCQQKAKIEVYNFLIRQLKFLKKHVGESLYNEIEFEQWMSMLKGYGNNDKEIMASIQYARDKAKDCLSKNLYFIHEDVKDLEITYRTLNSFFSNFGQEETDCLTLMNVNKAKLGSHDSDDTIAIRKELEQYYDKFSLKFNYSLLVMPSYLGDASTIKMWGHTASRNKVIMVTDFMDCLDFEMLIETLERTGLQGNDICLANVIMTCNHLLGRKRSELADEEDDVFIPGSGALAGCLVNTDEVPINKGVAGAKYGVMSSVKGTRIDLKKSQIVSLIDKGVIPMVEIDGRIMAFSDRSLYNGTLVGFQEYPTVRVLNWIEKVIQNFFNEIAFTLWNQQIRNELHVIISGFLNDYQGPEKLIENFRLLKLDLDPICKDFHLDFEVKLFSSPKKLNIKKIGRITDYGIEWL